MSIKIKYSLILLLIALGSIGFYFFGKPTKQHPTFSVNIKHVGETLSEEEQKLFNTIIAENKKFVSGLNSEQKSLLNSIENKVKNAIAKDSKVKINYKKLCDKNEYEVISAIRKYKKEMKAKTDKKIFKSMIKKLDRDQLMELMLYAK
jgi:hypothetical protein